MGGVVSSLEAFHFLRPAWLLALPCIVLLWWLVRRRALSEGNQAVGFAGHLAEALTVGRNDRSALQPIDSVVICLGLMALAAAGPSWSRVPNPFLSQTAPMVIVLETSGAMRAPDVPPNRMERAKFKVRDLVDMRAGARTALVAYAGTAHRVTPLTEDPEILRVMLEDLSPEIMPRDGTNVEAALALAQSELARLDTPGTILLVTAGITQADLPVLAGSDQDGPVLSLLVAPPDAPLGALQDLPSGVVVRLTADDADLREIERKAHSAYRATQLADERLEWEDRGWVFAWPAAIMLLFWFRRGWTMRWVLALALFPFALAPGQARADVLDWFLTPDQQGMLAYRNKHYSKAAAHFPDPMWRGHVLSKSGAYAEAADIFGRIDTADAAFAQGYALIRNRDYRGAIAAYERALELRPDFPEARANLELSRVILDYVETAREQSDTGEDSGIGADEVVFDNEAERGVETETDFSQEEAPEFTTTEQWMRSLDTQMGDFLRTRFLIEASESGS